MERANSCLRLKKKPNIETSFSFYRWHHSPYNKTKLLDECYFKDDKRTRKFARAFQQMVINLWKLVWRRRRRRRYFPARVIRPKKVASSCSPLSIKRYRETIFIRFAQRRTLLLSYCFTDTNRCLNMYWWHLSGIDIRHMSFSKRAIYAFICGCNRWINILSFNCHTFYCHCWYLLVNILQSST